MQQIVIQPISSFQVSVDQSKLFCARNEVTSVLTSVWLATLPEDGPSGGYFHMESTLPW